MDLRNNNITVREIMNNPKAKQLLIRELSGYVNPQMLSFAGNMTLKTVVGFSRGRIPPQKVESLITQLKEL